MRAQATLPALAVALLAVTAAAALGVATADGAFADAARDPGERRVAVALSEQLAVDGPLAVRRNVVDGERAAALSVAELERRFPVVGDRAVRVRLDGRTLVVRGAVDRGTTVERVVLVGHRQAVTHRPPVAGGAVALPRRTSRVGLALDPPAGTTVSTVRANDRVVLRNESGLAGNFTVSVSRFETVRLSFEATGPLPRGSVAVTYYPVRTRKATLEVTVGA